METPEKSFELTIPEATKLGTLERLNAQALINTYSIDEIDWKLKVNHDKFWSPESIIALSYLPIYKDLSQEFKIKYNQLNSLGIAEIFMLFEEWALAPSMEDAKARTTSKEFQTALDNFIQEEYKHSEIFRRLLMKAMPGFYAKNNFAFRFIRMNFVSKYLLKALIHMPNVLPAWVWVAIFFEERTLLFSREYALKQKQKPDSIDELFYQAHYFHMIDEMRHVRLDEHLIENSYRPWNLAHRKLIVWIVRKFIRRSAHPVNMVKSCLEHIENHTPHLITRELKNEILQQAKTLSKNPAFLEFNFGERAAPRTYRLMNKFSEFSDFWIKLVR